VSGQPLLTHGAEKAQGAAAAVLAPAPYLAPEKDKKGNTNADRRGPKDDVHVGRFEESKDMLLVDSVQALLGVVAMI